jgi:acyl-CoA thioester hydrolase
MTERYSAQYRVTIGDINYGGHLGNDKALIIFQDARIQFLQSLGCSEKDIGDGRGIIMVESGVRYLREVFLHDELTVSIVVTELKGKKFSFDYAVRRDADGELVISGFTAFLAFAYEGRKVAAVPEGFKKKLSAFISG